jgi:hypothetical protein
VATNTREPVQITAGDTVSFTKSLANYPASQGWNLKYVLNGGADPIIFTSIASGDDHVILVPAATTAQWLPADYELTGFAENAGVRNAIYIARLTVSINVESTDPGETRTHAQRMVISLEAQLEKMAQDDIIDSSVEGTQIRREARKEIYTMRKKYQRERESEIAAENIRNGKQSGRKIVTRLNVSGIGCDNSSIFRGAV